MSDVEWMRLALDLATRGEGTVNPNPLVGVVIVKDDAIIGRGHHQRFGGPHAEVVALDEAGTAASGATLYSTLEPCCHHGKTPPCTDRIIAAGVARVVVAAQDPNTEVDGKGILALRNAGIDVTEGVLQEEAQLQNEIYFTYVQRDRPFVQLKLALSLDGRIATSTGDARWISSKPSRVEAHRLRRKFMSVAIGVQTVTRDDPLLTVRHVEGPDPVPVILDREGRLPLTARLLDTQSTPIVATATMPPDIERRLAAHGARILRFPDPDGQIDLHQLVRALAAEPLDSVLVEGGGETAAAFLNAGLVDKVSLFLCPLLIGGRDAVPAVGGVGARRIADAMHLENVTTRWLGPDLLYEGYPVQHKN